MAERRRAVGFLGEDVIARMLALPEGLRVVAISADFLRNGVRVMIEGDALDPVPEGHEPPRIDVKLLDASLLADTEILGASVYVGGDREAPALTVDCPRFPCQCEQEWEHGATLGVVAEGLRQHIAGAHT